jgi:hypothetical protein
MEKRKDGFTYQWQREIPNNLNNIDQLVTSFLLNSKDTGKLIHHWFHPRQFAYQAEKSMVPALGTSPCAQGEKCDKAQTGDTGGVYWQQP